MDFLNRLARNPYAPIDSASITSVDELGNGYDDWNNLIAPKYQAPEQSWGDIAFGVATAPARMATGLAAGLSPYGSEGWRVPPLAQETWDSITAPGRAYYEGMSPEEMQHTAATAAGLMMGGGGLAAGRAPMLAANASKEAGAAAILSSLEQAPTRSYHGTTYNVKGQFIPSDDGLLGPGVYSSQIPSGANIFAGRNVGHINNPIMNHEHGKVFPFDVHGRIASEDDWMRVLSDIPGATTRVDQDRSVSLAAQNALANEGFGSVQIGDTINTFAPGTIKSPLTGETLFSNADTRASLPALANALSDEKGIIAYHGSPHSFDRFDMSKIGSGEGAQAYR